MGGEGRGLFRAERKIGGPLCPKNKKLIYGCGHSDGNFLPSGVEKAFEGTFTTDRMDFLNVLKTNFAK